MKLLGRKSAGNRPGISAPEIDIALTLPPRRYCPHVPTPKQLAFLLCPRPEVFFGGAAGGGKTDALLMGCASICRVAKLQRPAAAADLSAIQPTEFDHEPRAPVAGA